MRQQRHIEAGARLDPRWFMEVSQPKHAVAESRPEHSNFRANELSPLTRLRAALIRLIAG